MTSGINHPAPEIKKKRSFVPAGLRITNWDSVSGLFEELLSRPVQSAEVLFAWLKDRSELSAVLEEDLAWRYIRMNCDTSNKDHVKSYELFVKEIQPEILIRSNLLDKKFYDASSKESLDPGKFEVFNRALNTRIELYRDENIPLFSQLHCGNTIETTGTRLLTIMNKLWEWAIPVPFLKSTTAQGCLLNFQGIM